LLCYFCFNFKYLWKKFYLEYFINNFFEIRLQEFQKTIQFAKL
jgi:hypothetical protein